MAKQNTKMAEVFHFDLQGKREEKYEFLNQNSIASIQWNKLEPNEPNFFLVEKNFDGIVEYEKGFKVDELFGLFKMGSATGKDEIFVDLANNSLKQKLILNNINFNENEIKLYNYRLFDKRYFLYNNHLIQRLRVDLQKHFFKDNLALVTTKILSSKSFFHSFISKNISDRCLISNKGQEGNYFFPLYLYPEATPSAGSGQAAQQTIGHTSTNSAPERTSNLNHEIALKIARSIRYMYDANVSSVNSTYRDTGVTLIAPLDILDYIYAVLHSPTYREKYKEFLKIDFPRIPYPKNAKIFWQLVKLGGEIRQIHLLESPTVEKYITQYPIDGDNVVIKPNYQNGKVYINDTQYFDNVPEIAWNFFIGGYQPAQKWLKDRKERKLEFDDILHYQKIIVALSETDRLMKEIEKIEII
jgi:predicted helicase